MAEKSLDFTQMEKAVQMGQRIRRMREREHMSQKEMAELAGISSSYLWLIEHGERNMTVNLLCRFVEILGTSADEILFGTDMESDRNCAIYRKLAARYPQEKLEAALKAVSQILEI